MPAKTINIEKAKYPWFSWEIVQINISGKLNEM